MTCQLPRVLLVYLAILGTARNVYAQVAPSTATKNTRFEYTHLRSGSIKTRDGWNFADFAVSLMNPNSAPIEVVVTLRSDDPHFQFRDGSVGIWHTTIPVAPFSATTTNVFGYGALALLYLEHFPVRSGTNFTGSLELSAPLPFYSYSGSDMATQPAVDADEIEAYNKSWDPWQGVVPVVWDTDLRLFVAPYTNYWHNEKSFPTGWHTELTVTNNNKSTVTYSVRHKPGYGGEQDPMLGCNVMKPFVEQTRSIVLAPGESLHTSLEDFYGWNKDWTSAMEGLLTLQAEPESAAPYTTITVTVVPNLTGAQSCVAETPIFAVIADVPPSPWGGIITVAAEPVLGRGIQVAGVEFFLDGDLLATAADAPYDARIDTRPFESGSHVLSVRARSENGETALSSVVVTVSNPGK